LGTLVWELWFGNFGLDWLSHFGGRISSEHWLSESCDLMMLVMTMVVMMVMMVVVMAMVMMTAMVMMMMMKMVAMMMMRMMLLMMMVMMMVHQAQRVCHQ
jgi:hypothetical protein